MNIGNKYRQNYCDFYPQTRRLGKKRLTRAAVAALTVSWCIFFSGLLASICQFVDPDSSRQLKRQ